MNSNTEQMIVSDFQIINGLCIRPVVVRPGGKLTVNGSLGSSLVVEDGASSTINGVATGDVRVESGGRVVSRGTISGEVYVEAGGQFEVLPGSAVLGPVTRSMHRDEGTDRE